MSIFNDIAGLLRGSVGNNMDNDPDDVMNTKRNFAAIGRYKKPVENGFIDKELDDAIYSHQRDNNLKVDGIMKPGGETEASIVGHRLKLPLIESSEQDKKKGILQANAVPLFGALALGLGMTATGAAQWWQNQSHKDRENVTKGLQNLRRPETDEDPFQHCEDILEDNIRRCREVQSKYGYDAYRICRESAMFQYAQCRANKPVEQWRQLQDQ